MDKRLLKAATSGDSTSMKAMVASHDSSILLRATPSGNTCLHISSTYGHEGFCKDVLELDESLLAALNLGGETPLITAVRNGHVSLASFLLWSCCQPASRRAILQQDKSGYTALHHAIRNGHKDLALELITAEPTLSQAVSKCNESPLFMAVRRNFTHIYEKLMQNPDCAYSGGQHGYNCLHAAVMNGDQAFVKTIMDKHPELAGQAADMYSCTPVRQAVQHGKVDMLRNEVIMLMSKANPQDVSGLRNLHWQAKQETTDASRKDAKSLTQMYTSNTSLVAILIATITFAAPFTLPGGYSNNAGSEGLPIMSNKFAFHVFLISDTLAMCSSFTVAFICIIARWEDYEFLIYYRSFTKKLMWFAYVATTTAFSTGLYTVLAPRLQWLGILICVMVALLPILTKLLGEWPVFKLKVRLGKSFNSDLLDMV
ncbi:hypothetical protein ACQ4PT_051555 [Festuca glaucescens]